MKSIWILFLMIFLVGCGVDTDSSAHSTKSSSSDSDSNTSDSNGTDNGSDDNDDGISVDTSSNTLDKTDAEFDANACILNDTYQAISDSSFDPVAQADIENGVELSSTLPYSLDNLEDGALVVLYYPDLVKERKGQFVNVYVGDDYRFSFDNAWLLNDDKTVYVKTPAASAAGKPSCYRFELSSSDATGISSVKVYR